MKIQYLEGQGNISEALRFKINEMITEMNRRDDEQTQDPECEHEWRDNKVFTGTYCLHCGIKQEKPAKKEESCLTKAVEIITEELKGIDSDELTNDYGWWETSTGAEWGANKLKTILERLKDLKGRAE